MTTRGPCGAGELGDAPGTFVPSGLMDVLSMLRHITSSGSKATAEVQMAVRGAAAMPAIVACLGCADDALRSCAMRLVSQLAPPNCSEIAGGGGIALLCDSLLAAAREPKLQARARNYGT